MADEGGKPGQEDEVKEEEVELEEHCSTFDVAVHRLDKLQVIKVTITSIISGWRVAVKGRESHKKLVWEEKQLQFSTWSASTPASRKLHFTDKEGGTKLSI